MGSRIRVFSRSAILFCAIAASGSACGPGYPKTISEDESTCLEITIKPAGWNQVRSSPAPQGYQYAPHMYPFDLKASSITIADPDESTIDVKTRFGEAQSYSKLKELEYTRRGGAEVKGMVGFTIRELPRVNGQCPP
jgi:hypothetical protein